MSIFLKELRNTLRHYKNALFNAIVLLEENTNWDHTKLLYELGIKEDDYNEIMQISQD